MFRNPDDPENSLKAKIPEGKKAIADKGYLGEQHTKIAPPSQYDSRELAEFKNRARARHSRELQCSQKIFQRSIKHIPNYEEQKGKAQNSI
ncbi:hypothetical protein IV203_026283 [Nitzschia inconspicua]|uniref:Uncharacterized protein n=1 Tax=Nitzschia inconspicua TaxID=303405 RepID=A0A9K3PX33_9STRA|nr:hypothetical protein IV203_026283 [Nitzschia inconspicua]